jgi:UDP-N-acetylmuramoylalanine--D-glutamate ligase
LRIERAALAGMKVTVMGLGINGGGLASALFFARHGARVTVTDLRTAEVLRESMERLADFTVRYVLGRHEETDFTGADLVIKNPAVPPSSPFLAAARGRGVPIETDLSVFLSLASNPVIAVTGSKGKSTTASAIAFALSRAVPGTRLGGNITVSPLSFLDEREAAGPAGAAPGAGLAPIVLELSSWQLGDLKGRGLLKPAISVFTVILPDHLDKYPGMAEYVADKKVIFQGQEPGQKAVFNLDDPWQRDFPRETAAQPFFYSSPRLPDGLRGAWLEGGARQGTSADAARPGGARQGTSADAALPGGNGRARLEPDGTGEEILAGSLLPGSHNRVNLLCAGLALRLFGVQSGAIRSALAEFPGVEHRLELFRTWKGIRFYNDSAATIPHATVRAVQALSGPVVLITGGTDKNIDFSPLAAAARTPSAIVLLPGTGTEKMRTVLDGVGASYEGPYGTLREAVEAGIARARATDGASVLFSPGCTSFGMFLNEFDRGRKFKEMVDELTAEPPEASRPL